MSLWVKITKTHSQDSVSSRRRTLEARRVQTHAFLTVPVREWSGAVSAFLRDGVAPSVTDCAASSGCRPRPAQDRIARASVRQAAAASATCAPPTQAPSAERLLQKNAYVYIGCFKVMGQCRKFLYICKVLSMEISKIITDTVRPSITVVVQWNLSLNKCLSI